MNICSVVLGLLLVYAVRRTDKISRSINFVPNELK
jgi:hypothetical protein